MSRPGCPSRLRWRRRTGREPTGPVLIAVLVFAGTLLTIAPAAGLLAAGS